MIAALNQETSNEKKTIPWYRIIHTSIEILIFIILVVITTLLLQPLQEIMKTRMTELQEGLISRLEVVLGRHIRYDTLGPSLFGTLDMRNIRIYDDESRPVMTIARVRISYSLIDLIRTGVLQSIRLVQLDRPVIAVDMQRDADLLRLFSGGSTEGAASFSLAEVLNDHTKLRIRNGFCGITSVSEQYTLDELRLDASLEQGTLRFQGQWNAAATTASLLPEPITAYTACRISGSYIEDLQEGSANLYLNSVSGSLGPQDQRFHIRPITFSLTLEDQRLALKKVADKAPFDFSADYDFRSGKLSGALQCEQFTPQELLRLEGPWKDYKQWLNLSTSGNASVVLDTETKGIRYDLALTGQIPQDLLPMGKSSFVIQGSGTENGITLKTLALRFPQGDLRYQGTFGFTPFAPQGLISIANLSLTGTDFISGDIRVATQDRKISFQGTGLSFGAVPIPALQGSVLLQEEGLAFSASLSCFEDVDTQDAGILGMEGFLDYDPRYGEIHLVIDSFSVADILDMIRPFQTLPGFPSITATVVSNTASPSHLLDPIRVSTEVFMTTDFTRFSYHAPRFTITYQEQEQPVFTGIISGTDQYIACTEGQLKLTEDPISLSGQVNLKHLQDISFSLNAAYQDRPYHLEGVILDRHSISIQGSYGLRAYIMMTDFEGYSGYIEAENIPIPYKGQFARLSLKSTLRYDTPDFWYFDLEQLELADVSIPQAPQIALRISGRVDQKGAWLPELLFDDGRGALKGKLALAWNKHFSEVSGAVHMGTDTGEEQYDLKAHFKDKQLQLALSGLNMQILRFVDNPYDAVASGELQVTWNSMDSFSGEVQLTSLSAAIADTVLEMQGSGTITNETLCFQTMNVQYGSMELKMPLLQINLPEQRMEGEAQIQMLVPGSDLELAFTVGMDFKPIHSWFHLPEVANAFQGVLHVEQARFNTLNAEVPFDLVFSRTNSLISLSGGPHDMIRVQISDTGDFYAGLSNPSPIRGTVVGTIGTKTIDVQSPDVYVDLAALGALIPRDIQDIIALTGGFVTASIQVSGSLGDPDFFGIAQGYSVQLKLPQYVSQEIRPVPITVVLNGNELSFGPIPAAVGSGQGMVAGWFRFDRWIPNTFTLNINVPSETPIPFAYDSMGIVAQGHTWGTLNLSMQDFVFSIQGDLAALNTDITLNTEKLTAGPGGEGYTPFISSIVTDITLRAGRKVEFIWPTKEFPILQAYADQGSSLHIKSDSASNHYSFTGDVNLRSGEIFYFERSFYLREGLLSFNENELQFDPRISARAEVRDQTNEGPVTISMIIDNAPLQSFVARFESTPPLSQIEIFSMLGQTITGAPTEEGNDKVQYAFLASTADILAQTQVLRHLQRRIRDLLSLDMFSFRTQILQNLVSQTIRPQDDTDTNNNRGVGNSFDNTAVFLGKYIGPDVFLQVITSLRYDEYRRDLEGFTPNGLSFGGYTLEPDIGMELRGPLFDIRMNVVPRHAETMFINDISCTLTWRRSMFSIGDLFR